MSRPFRTAVIGVGHMGRHHARVYSELPESQLVAVVDSNLERARELASKYGCAAFAAIEDLNVEVEAATADAREELVGAHEQDRITAAILADTEARLAAELDDVRLRLAKLALGDPFPPPPPPQEDPDVPHRADEADA